MKLVAISLVKNELDIIEAFVRQALSYVDCLVVMDNGSTDGTLEILKALAVEDARVDLVEDPRPGKHQAARTNRLLHEFAIERHAADWILPLDADEFLTPLPDGDLIPADADPETPLELPWRTYVPTASDLKSERNPVVRIRHRRGFEQPQWYKSILSARLACRPGIAWSAGNHEVQDNGQRIPHRAAGAALAHFPLRSPGQFLSKIAVNALQFRCMADRRYEAGWHYSIWYDVLRRDPEEFFRRFHEAARLYCAPPGCREAELIEDPIPYAGGELRHTPAFEDLALGWRTVLAQAEAMANRLGVLQDCVESEGQLAADRVAAILERAFAGAMEHYRGHLLHSNRSADLERQVLEMQDHLVRHRESAAQQVIQHHAQFQAQLEQLSQFSASQQREINALTQRAAEQERELERLRRLIAEMQRSEQELLRSLSWRVGSSLVQPLGRVARLVGLRR